MLEIIIKELFILSFFNSSLVFYGVIDLHTLKVKI